MGKKLLITEKPSVAMEFAKALKITTNRKNGYLESDSWIITWCVGHLVTMSYPDKYDEKLKTWRLETLPFIPEDWKYEIIPQVANQFNIVKELMQREDIEEIYKQYFEVVNKYLFCLTHDSNIAEELTQETFYKAIKKIDKFKGECKIQVWLCQTAKNLWYDEIKKNRRRNN